jgi:superfamily II DNA or RNA helicase
MKQLREYQVRTKDKLREAIRAGRNRVVVYLPTGGGKSVVALDLIKSLISNGKRVAFIANRIGLVAQFSQKHLTPAGIHHGVIQGSNTHGLDRQCIVCSIQTVARRGLPQTDYAIIDESHAVAGSKDYRKLIFDNPETKWIGLSATPFSKGMAKVYDELGGPLFQDLIVGATIQELISLGSLVDCEIYAPSEPDLANVKVQRNSFGEMDYNEKQLAQAVDKVELIGDIVSNWFRLASGKRTVVFATNVPHSKHIVEQFTQCGIKAEHIDGYMTDEEKLPIAERFAKGETTIISNVAMLREGWDVPECEVMILARPTRSLIAWVQMVGRILRPANGKTVGIVIDHSGSVHRLGYPTEDLPLELCDGTKKDAEPKKQAEKKDRVCPNCGVIKKTKICQKCGHVTESKQCEVEIADGEIGKVVRHSKEEKQAWFSQLLCYAKSKGYAHGWAANKYREKFGVWPKSLHEGHDQPGQDVLNWITSRQIAWRATQKKKTQTVSHEEGMSNIAKLKGVLNGH